MNYIPPFLALLCFFALSLNFNAQARTVTITDSRTLTATELQANDDLVIAGNADIQLNEAILLRSLIIRENAKLTNIGEIHISGSLANGFENHGEFVNNGLLYISQTTRIGIFNKGKFIQNKSVNIYKSGTDAILNEGANAYFYISQYPAEITIRESGVNRNYGSGLNNSKNAGFENAGGILMMDIADDGIYNHLGATFFNTGHIKVSNAGTKKENGEGILNVNEGSKFENFGIIELNNLADEGIQNENALFLNTKGKITISNAGYRTIEGNGIFNLGEHAVFFNTNKAHIKIFKTGDDGIENREGAQFENLGEAEILINNTGLNSKYGEGIYNHGNNTRFVNAATIEIAENIGDDGIYNHNGAEFDNSGNIDISGTGSVSKTGDGIINTQTASFSNSGLITLNNISDDGIQNGNQGIFLNHTEGKISIAGTGSNNSEGDGIHNTDAQSEFYNAGGINLTENIGDDGIDNKAAFSNNGSLTIEHTGNNNAYGDGIHNHGAGAIFNNNKNLVINGKIGDDGIYNQSGATFKNNASLTIGNTGTQTQSGDGIINANANSRFVNAGNLTLTQAIGDEGIQNEDYAVFENTSGASIHIANTGSTGIEGNGIFNTSGASFNNAGNITLLQGIHAEGIRNQAKLTNAVCAEIANAYRINNTGAAQFQNAGLLRLTYAHSQINEGILINTGIIEDRFGSLSNTEYDNLQMVAAPVEGGTTSVSNALQLANNDITWQASEVWYENAAQNRNAGAYHTATNKLSHQLPEGEHTAWFTVTNPASGCKHQIAETVTINAKSDLPVSSMENKEELVLQITPNPVSSQATLTFAVNHPEAASQRATLSIYALTGKKVKTLHRGRTASNSPQNIGYDVSKLPAGIYLVELSTSNGKKITKRLVVAH